jgi:hypothetical protein
LGACLIISTVSGVVITSHCAPAAARFSAHRGPI